MKNTKKIIRAVAFITAVLSLVLLASCKKTPEAFDDTTADTGGETVEIKKNHSDIVDENGKVIGLETYFKNGEVKSQEYYNENGDVISSVIYNEDGTKDAEQTISYDIYHNPVQYITLKYYYENGSLKEYNRSFFDSKQLAVKSESYNGDGSLQGAFAYEHDDYGNVTVEKVFGPENYVIKTYYRTYNEKSLLTEEKLLGESSQFLSLVKYEYNENDRLVKETKYKENGEISSYAEYEYAEGSKDAITHIYVSDGNGGFMEY